MREEDKKKKRRRPYIFYSLILALALITAISSVTQASTNRPLRYYAGDGGTAMTYYLNSTGDQNRSLWGINTDNPLCELDINGSICINRTGYYLNGAAIGTGAPTSASYVTLSTDPDLTNERTLMPGKGLTLIDFGAGNDVQLNITGLEDCTGTQVSQYNGTEWNCITPTGGSGNATGNITGTIVSGEGVYAYNTTELRTNKILYVEPNNATDIQNKINQCPTTGCTVIIPSGIYTINASITLVSNLTVIGQGESTLLISQTNYTGSVLSTNSGVENLKIENFKIDGNRLNHDAYNYSANNESFGIYFNQTKNTSIENMKIVNMIDAGIHITRSTNQLIKNNYVSDAVFCIATFSQSEATTITNNIVRNCDRYGIEIKDGNSGIISNNDVSYNGEIGIGVFDSSESSSVPSSIIIVSNICSNNNNTLYARSTGTGSGIQVYYESSNASIRLARRVVISNNICNNNTGNGIRSYYPQSIISGNIVSQNTGIGVQAITFAEDFLFEGNIVSENLLSGLQINGAMKRVVISSNIFLNNSMNGSGQYSSINFGTNINDVSIIGNSFEGSRVLYHIAYNGANRVNTIGNSFGLKSGNNTDNTAINSNQGFNTYSNPNQNDILSTYINFSKFNYLSSTKYINLTPRGLSEKNLTLLYTYEESVKDYSVSENNASSVTGTYTEGWMGSGINITGSQYVSPTQSFNFTNSEFTLCSNYKATTSGTNNMIVAGFNTAGGSGNRMRLFIDSTDRLSLILYNSTGSTLISATHTQQEARNEWNDACISYNKVNISICSNGNCEIQTNLSGSIDAPIWLFIGSAQGGTNAINGTIDNTAVYTRALSNQEIKTRYYGQQATYPQERINWNRIANFGNVSLPGTLNISSTTYTPTLCLSGDCRSVWPSGGGSGNVTGSSAPVTQYSIARFDTTTGASINGSAATLSDTALTVPSSSSPSITTNGSIGYDTDSRSYKAGGYTGQGSLVRTIYFNYTNADNITAASGTGEKTFLTNYTFPANYFVAGKVTRVTVGFQWNSTGGPTSLTRMKLGGTTIAAPPSATAYASATRQNVGAIFTLYSINANSTNSSIDTAYHTSNGDGWLFGRRNSIPQPLTFNTAANLTLSFTNTWSATTAGNVLSIHHIVIEELN